MKYNGRPLNELLARRGLPPPHTHTHKLRREETSNNKATGASDRMGGMSDLEMAEKRSCVQTCIFPARMQTHGAQVQQTPNHPTTRAKAASLPWRAAEERNRMRRTQRRHTTTSDPEDEGLDRSPGPHSSRWPGRLAQESCTACRPALLSVGASSLTCAMGCRLGGVRHLVVSEPPVGKAQVNNAAAARQQGDTNVDTFKRKGKKNNKPAKHEMT